MVKGVRLWFSGGPFVVYCGFPNVCWVGPPRVLPFWGDTILWYKANKKENNMLNMIGNVEHTVMD